jgi:hypothetical protein
VEEFARRNTFLLYLKEQAQKEAFPLYLKEIQADFIKII